MGRTRTLLPLLALLTAAVLAVPAPADAQGLYVGGAYSWASASTDHPDFDEDVFEDDASAYKVVAGLEFSGFFGVEGSYTSFGSYDAGELEGFDESPGEAEADGWGLALTGNIPIGKIFTFYAKAGYFFWDSKVSGTEDFLDQWGEAATSGEDPYYGAGLRVNFGKLGIFGEYERYVTDSLDFDLVNIGVRLTF
jgi:hypothetical protein